MSRPRSAPQRRPELRVTLEVPDDGFLPCVERRLPAGRSCTQRLAFRRFHTHNPRAETQQFAPCEGPGQVAREVRDQDPGKCLHYAAYID